MTNLEIYLELRRIYTRLNQSQESMEKIMSSVNKGESTLSKDALSDFYNLCLYKGSILQSTKLLLREIEAKINTE